MSYAAPSFITHREVEAFLGGGARGTRQRQRLQQRGLLPEPVWLPRVDRLRVGLLPTFALAGLLDDELGAAPKARDALLALTADAVCSKQFRELTDVVGVVIREMVAGERGGWVFDALVQRLARDAGSEMTAWSLFAEDVEEELRDCGVLFYSEVGRVQAAQDDVVIVAMPDARVERFPTLRAAASTRNGDAVAVEHVKVMATEREFLMPAVLTPVAALDWSQVSERDWDGMLARQAARADAWEFATDAGLPASDATPMIIAPARSGREAALALMAEHPRA